jgi:GH15 family glucan-1,4-alpha-glucosidase
LEPQSIMAGRIEDYALVGDCETASLVGRDGSVDWLCLPRFDSAACFAALLGTRDHGRWLLAPAGEVRAVGRRYRDGTLVLETEYETDDGAVALIDCMPPRTEAPALGEGAFLPCSFWLADNLALQGRQAEARQLFERLLAVRNDVGLLAEEYDPVAGRLLGNFPQSFSHVGLVNTARNLTERGGPAEHRQER